MPTTRSLRDKALKFLQINKIVTLAQMAVHLQCSTRTVQRRFAQWQFVNSYNQNGKYYTPPDIPTFDANGLWRFQDAFFSRFGNLPATFVALLKNSQAGLTAAEAGEILALRPSSFLWSLRDHPGLRREKHQGRYVYFSSDRACCHHQRERRSRMKKAARLPTDSEAVAILVEKIKQPGLSHKALSRRLRKQKLHVEAEAIENLFIRHNLAVKKTPPSS